jgi:hypothetical protein
MKGMILNVYSNPVYRKCAMYGPTSWADEVLLVGPGVPEIFEAGDRPVLVLKEKVSMRGGMYIYAEPIEDVPEGYVGYMFGANYIHSSDSRIRDIAPYPIPVHDRSEDADFNAMMSR